jgi:hypothetical protein
MTTFQQPTSDPQQGPQPNATLPPTSGNPIALPDVDEVMEEFRRRAASSLAHSKDWREEAKELFDYVAGRQWDADDETRMREQNRPMVTFNLMSKFIDVVMGLQINNRQEIRCYPRRNGTVAVNDIATGALAWCRDQCGAEFEESDAGHDTLLTGMGWIEDFYSDQDDPGGAIAQERRDPLEMLWDPMARKKNLVDRRWQIRLKRVTFDEYKDLFDKEPTGSVAVVGMDPGDIDAGLQVITKPQDYDGQAVPNEARGHFMVADYQFYVLHTVWNVTAQFPGAPLATQQFSNEEWPQVQEQLKSQGIPHQPSKEKVKRFYRCWITNEGIDGTIKQIPSFTFHAITGKRDRNKNLWYGLGRNLKDPQRWVNAFFSSIIWQLMVNAKGGVMIEEDAVEDSAEFEDSWADPSKPTFVRSGAITAGKIQPKPDGSYPQGMDRLMQFSMDALPGVSGINAELLGLTDRQQPGIVEAQRKQGALAIVAWYFDGLRRYYQEAGRVMLGMIRDFMADGRLIRIVGQEGAQYIPLLRDPLTATFDIVVDEAPTSVNMRERVYAVLKELIPICLQAGIQIPKEVLDYAPIPDDLAQKWKQTLQPSPQQQQAQAQAQQTAQRAADAKIAKDQASAAESTASAQLKTVEAQTGALAAPTKIALDHVETIRKAAEAGALQAGGG